jgi:pYEATS domain-containing protein involved in immunity
MGEESYFDQKVGGSVRAEMVLDEKNEPVQIKGDSLNHYRIRLFLDTPNPDVESVTYNLDPTYYDPVRESTDRDSQFGVEITTYGDYPVTVDAQVRGEIVREVVPLAKLLKQAYEDSTTPEISSALSYIAKH